MNTQPEQDSHEPFDDDRVPEITPDDAPLPAWIYSEADRQGLSLGEVADLLGMSRPYLFRLRRSPAACQKLGRQYIDSIAKFLGIPVIAVMVAAGQLRAEDLSIQDDNAHEEIDRALRYIQEDPLWAVMLADVTDLNHGLKALIVRSYEQQEGKKLLSDRSQQVNSLIRILFGDSVP